MSNVARLSGLAETGANPPHGMPPDVADAINQVMAKVKNVEKHGENKFHGYKFAKVEDLLFQVQPAMVESGLIIVQDEIAHDLIADGSVMTATYAFHLAHKSGAQWADAARHTGMAGARNSKGGFDDKALNKCHTAARKYFLLGLFQVPAGDLPDADSDGDHDAPPRQAAKPPQAVEMAINLLRGCGSPELFKDAWLSNCDGWKRVMDAPDYAKVQAVKAEMVKKFQAEAEERAKAEQRGATQAQPDPFAPLEGDNIPW